MRIYVNFAEAVNETRRDLAEMGITVHPQTMQDKFVGDNDDYITKELQNYMYTVMNADKSLGDLDPVQPWAYMEFAERISPVHVNPGEAWKTRAEVWTEFLHNGEFAYTYNERLRPQLETFIEELIRHPESRQLYVSIWDPEIDPMNLGGVSRVPCSLGYLFQFRGGALHMTYFMRSCDFATHFQNDAYLAVSLLKYVAARANLPVGNFTHYMGSLHVYAKDVKGVF